MKDVEDTKDPVVPVPGPDPVQEDMPPADQQPVVDEFLPEEPGERTKTPIRGQMQGEDVAQRLNLPLSKRSRNLVEPASSDSEPEWRPKTDAQGRRIPLGRPRSVAWQTLMPNGSSSEDE